VSVYAKPVGPGEPQLVATIANPTSPFLTVNWPLPDPGDWVLSASGTRKSDGQHIDTAGIVVHVLTASGSSTGGATSLSPFPPVKK
jgi:hypothetical protein